MIAEIVFAAGCFWGVEKHFESLPGVIDVKSGYVGGNFDNPSYKDVLKYRNLNLQNSKGIVNHTEGVLVTFDDSIISNKDLIKSFWEIHDPTQKNKQGNDVGNNYRSGIFFTNVDQKEIAYKTKADYQTLLSEHGYGEIQTTIKPLDIFWKAEKYHQDYLKKNPSGYCPDHSTGVKFEDKKMKVDHLIPFQGKEIIVVESQGFCPYCQKLKEDVLDHYEGSVPVRVTFPNALAKFDIKTKLDAAPTIVFIQDSKEVFSHRGYLKPKKFYELLGKFKLGVDSESYEVAFNKGTDARFCKQYDIFKDTPDGVFIDIVSGDILFDTKDRFNSRSGWLSFFKAVDGSTIEKPDFSYGMNRVEVIAKKSGIHLGHVFERPDGKRRFCINATVLEFIPRAKIKKGEK